MINEFKYGQTWKIWPSPLSLSLYSTFKEFYPPITENLLKKALTFAEAHTHTHTYTHTQTHLSDDDKAIIHHARKSLLFNDQHSWIKRYSGLFDVTIGAYDGAEVCKLIGNYLLYKLSKLYEKKDIGLYEMTDWWFLRIKVDQNQKKIKSQFKLYSGGTSWR